MLSVITTELSTSMPIASSMPIIVRMLSVRPRKYIAASVTSSDAGTARLTMSVVGRWRRKKSSMKKLSVAPIRPALRSSCSESRMLSAWLPTTRILMPCSCGQLARLVDRRDDAVGDVHDVRLRRLEDVDADGGTPVHAPSDRQLRRDQFDLRDVRDAHPGAMSTLRTSSRLWNSPIGRTVNRESFSVISPALTEKLLDSSTPRSFCTSML